MKKLLYLLLIGLAACVSSGEETALHGIDPANMDATANPKDDFYKFANGAWLDKTEYRAKPERGVDFLNSVKKPTTKCSIYLTKR